MDRICGKGIAFYDYHLFKIICDGACCGETAHSRTNHDGCPISMAAAGGRKKSSGMIPPAEKHNHARTTPSGGPPGVAGAAAGYPCGRENPPDAEASLMGRAKRRHPPREG
jgi:hypothetical protein